MLYRRPQTVIFLGVQAGWPEYRIVRKGLELATYLVAPQIFYCDIDA